MNEQQLAAVKQALEALESERDKYLEWGDEDGAPEDVYEAIAALQSIISQDAPPKQDVPETNFGNMAEPKIGCVNHDCDKCKAVQEPVAQDVQEKCRIETVPAKGGLLPTPPAPQPVPVKTYHDGKPWPVAPKPWVGLTDEERNECTQSPFTADQHRAIEAKLKEKNHDQ